MHLDKKEATAMFRAIKERLFSWVIRTPNHSMDEKLKKKVITSFNGKHDCSIRSLLLVMPKLDYEKVKKVFDQSSQKYPYGPMTNKEFNVALRILKIFDKFEYVEPDEKTVWDFIEDRDNVYILLFPGHYTVVKYGRIVDFFPTSLLKDREVGCYWRVKEQVHRG